MTMKLSIAVLLMTISCCAAVCCDLKNWTVDKQIGNYLALRLKNVVLKYSQALESPLENRELLQKCALLDLGTLVQEIATESGCPPDDILRQIGITGFTLPDVNSLIQGTVSGTGLLNLNILQTLQMLLQGVTGLLNTVVSPLGINLSGVLAPVSGLTGGILGPILGSILSPTGLGAVLGSNGVAGGPTASVGSLSNGNGALLPIIGL